ncbi:MAG: adenylate/guanylate cyclase domain-containing protein [Pseudomonadota bacterium]
MDTAFSNTNKYSQETLLTRIGLLMYLVIMVQAMKLFVLDTPNWYHHLVNILFHGVCLLLSIASLKAFSAQWSKFSIFICFASYLVVACHLWQSDPAISYFLLLEIFVASLVFPNRENGAFALLIAILLYGYFYVQTKYAIPSMVHHENFYHVEKLNHITLASACVICAVYLRFMVTANWKRVKHTNKTSIDVIDKLVPKRFQSDLLLNNATDGVHQYESEECTILSLDIVNSTELMHSIGDLNAQQVFNRIFQEIDTLVINNNAFIIKTNGDQYLLAVGYNPGSSDANFADDISAYQAITLAIKANEILKTSYDNHGLAIRIGIASGRVYSGLSSSTHPVHDIWGETVVRCTRLENSARADEIMIDQKTFHAVGSYLSFAFRHKRTLLKGIGQTDTYRAKFDALQRILTTVNPQNTYLNRKHERQQF